MQFRTVFINPVTYGIVTRVESRFGHMDQFCLGQVDLTYFIKYVSGSDPNSALDHMY